MNKLDKLPSLPEDKSRQEHEDFLLRQGAQEKAVMQDLEHSDASWRKQMLSEMPRGYKRNLGRFYSFLDRALEQGNLLMAFSTQRQAKSFRTACAVAIGRQRWETDWHNRHGSGGARYLYEELNFTVSEYKGMWLVMCTRIPTITPVGSLAELDAALKSDQESEQIS